MAANRPRIAPLLAERAVVERRRAAHSEAGCRMDWIPPLTALGTFEAVGHYGVAGAATPSCGRRASERATLTTAQKQILVALRQIESVVSCDRLYDLVA
jgi:hypothetical protein